MTPPWLTWFWSEHKQLFNNEDSYNTNITCIIFADSTKRLPIHVSRKLKDYKDPRDHYRFIWEPLGRMSRTLYLSWRRPKRLVISVIPYSRLYIYTHYHWKIYSSWPGKMICSTQPSGWELRVNTSHPQLSSQAFLCCITYRLHFMNTAMMSILR